jgi:hypothetical protein
MIAANSLLVLVLILSVCSLLVSLVVLFLLIHQDRRERRNEMAGLQPAVPEASAERAPGAGPDSSLIAVLTAAVLSYEADRRGTAVSPAGFIVRKIRRV